MALTKLLQGCFGPKAGIKLIAVTRYTADTVNQSLITPAMKPKMAA